MRMLAVLASLTLVVAQPQPILFPAPTGHPEQIANTEDFPFIPPLSGARLIQTCLESAHYAGQMPSGVPSMLQTALELMVHPDASAGRWRWAA